MTGHDTDQDAGHRHDDGNDYGQDELRTAATVSDERVRLAERLASFAIPLRARRRRFSGIAWKPGLIVTADEALPDGESLHVGIASSAPALEIVGRDASTDVALLRAPDAAGPALSDFAAEPVRAGASILVVSAAADGPVLAAGIVASVGPEWRSLRGGLIDSRVELDVRLPRVAEGAPVFDARGTALGMAVSGPRGRTLLIPGSTVQRVATLLERDGAVPRGRIGAALQALPLDEGGRGLVVASVEADGPAARAGLFQGDLIIRVDGDEPRGLRWMMMRLGPGSVGKRLALTVRRGGDDRDVVIEIEAREHE